MVAVHQLVAEHKPEVAGMIHGKAHERQAQGSHVPRRIVRWLNPVQVLSQPLVSKQRHLGEQPFGAPEVMRRRALGHARALGGGAQ